MSKPIDEKITNIDEKIEQLKQQKKAILAKEREKERKARTRRLIQKGGIVEKYLPGIPDEMLAHGLDLVRMFLATEEALGHALSPKELEHAVKTLNSIIFKNQQGQPLK